MTHIITPKTHCFLQLNDLHMNPPGFDHVPGYKGANQRATYLLNAIAKQEDIPELDFVLGLGDLIHGESLESITHGLPWFKNQLQTMPCPFFPIMGNHEVKQNQGQPEWEAPFLNTFGSHANNYTVQYGNLLFLMFNNSGTGHTTQECRDRQLTWLRSTLDAHPDIPKILCCHVPLIPLRDTPILAKSFGFRSYHTLEPEILDQVNRHANTLKAVFSGHLHLTGMVVQNGIHHLSLSGTASSPGDYAVYHIRENSLDVRVRQVPQNLQNMLETNIHGRNRYPHDFTDATHLTHQTYLMGNNDERTFSIPLS